MHPPSTTSDQGCRQGCFIALATAVAVLAGLLGPMFVNFERDNPDSLLLLREQVVSEVRAGDDGSGSSIYESKTVEMLAADPNCIRNLTMLKFFMADLTGPGTSNARKLTNVRKVGFYSCYGADDVLTAMKGMASVEEFSFDTTTVSDDGVRLLASFPNLKKVYFAWVNDPAREKLLRETLPGVEIEIVESNELNPSPQPSDE